MDIMLAGVKFLRASAIAAGTARAAGISAPVAEAVNEHSHIPKGDIDIPRLSAALEIMETVRMPRQASLTF